MASCLVQCCLSLIHANDSSHWAHLLFEKTCFVVSFFWLAWLRVCLLPRFLLRDTCQNLRARYCKALDLRTMLVGPGAVIFSFRLAIFFRLLPVWIVSCAFLMVSSFGSFVAFLFSFEDGGFIDLCVGGSIQCSGHICHIVPLWHIL